MTAGFNESFDNVLACTCVAETAFKLPVLDKRVLIAYYWGNEFMPQLIQKLSRFPAKRAKTLDSVSARTDDEH